MKENYKILKVKEDASSKEIKESYHKLKKEFKGNNKKLAKLEEAYHALMKEDVKEEKKSKKEARELTKKQENMFKITIGILAGVIVLVGLFLVSEKAGITAQVAAKPLADITYSEFEELYKKEEKTVVIVGRPTCPQCVIYKPIVEKVNAKYDLDIKYLNTDEFSDEDKLAFLDFDKEVSGAQNGISTPMTFIVSDSKIVDRIDGRVDQTQVESFLSKNQMLPE